ncbi:S24 family peptidase [Pedobacter gandavensis]|uniref:S24 family peptidase n=1 Tax=Pedobacter gandavensis TaxID=2679963 RepID=UPI002479C59A|nr:S24 family peptidase [Pedobacter gandavensis]WGQ09109.1 S24 family peptidase [Pedobacter gandavensis]
MSEYQGEKFKLFLSKSKISAAKAADILGVTRQTIYQYYGSGNLTRETVSRILTKFNITEEEVFGPAKQKPHENAKLLGEIPEDNPENTKFIEISPGRYIMSVPFVEVQAKAGYLMEYADQHYLEELPKRTITVDKYHRGRYISFEVEGDSMNDGTIESVPDGCIITYRELKREHWKSRLHIHKYPNWVFVHRTEGVVVKRIKSQNLETGEIVLTSLNPDKNTYPDFTVHLNDILQILNVVKREL